MGIGQAMRRTAGLGAWALVMLASSTALGQRGLDVERFSPAMDAGGFLGVQGTRTPGPWLWTASLWTHYDKGLLETRDGARDRVAHRFAADVMAQLGITGRASVGARLPVILWQEGRSVDASLQSAAVGDPWLQARYRLLGEATDERGLMPDGPGLALQGEVALPIGHGDAYAGEPAARTRLQVLSDFHLFGIGAGVSLGWLHRFDVQSLQGKRFRDVLSFGAALKLPTFVVSDLGGILELRVYTDAGDPFGSKRTTAVEGDLGVRYAFGDASLTAGVGTGFVGRVGAPDVRAMLGVSWTPRVHDQDGDGIPDDEDQCPPLPEDRDGFQDHDGCPDPDNDNDLIPDEDDLCPNEEAPPGGDEDMDGCADRK